MTKREDSKKQFKLSKESKKGKIYGIFDFFKNKKMFMKLKFSEKIKYDLTEFSQLHKAENPWKPSHIKVPEKELTSLLKKFRSLLNKITEENFEYLIREIKDKQVYMIDSSEKLSAVS